jgi:hypothetical protein
MLDLRAVGNTAGGRKVTAPDNFSSQPAYLPFPGLNNAWIESTEIGANVINLETERKYFLQFLTFFPTATVGRRDASRRHEKTNNRLIFMETKMT